jgi:hypothetical protein
MKSSLKAKLEAAIASFLDQIAEDSDRPAGYVHPAMSEHMANAAEAVFDATFASSCFTEDETKASSE